MVTRAAALAAVLFLTGCPDEVGDDQEAAAPPAAPAGLAATARDGAVAVSWTDHAADETGFRLEVNDGPFGSPPFFDVRLLPAGATTATVPAPPNATRVFRVIAVTDASESVPSNIVTFTMPDVPVAPSYASALAIGIDEVELRWVAPANAVSTRVDRSFDGATWSQVGIVSGAGPRVALFGAALAPARTWYRLRASNVNGAGVAAETSTLTQTLVFRVAAASTGDVGSRAALAFTGGYTPHIAHYDATQQALMYTTYGSGFTTTLLDLGGTGFPAAPGWSGTSIAARPDGTLEVLAVNYHGGNLRHLRYGGSSWSATTIATSAASSPRVRIGAVPGSTRFLWQPAGAANLRILRRPDGTAPEQVFGTAHPAALHDLVTTPDGVDHVFAPGTDGIIRRHFGTGSTWSYDYFDDDHDVDQVSVAVDPAGRLHVAYHAVSAGRLMYATSPGGRFQWTLEVVHEHFGGNVGLYPSIAVHPPTGRVFIAYQNAVQKDLWVATKDPGGAWESRLWDSTGDVGRWPSAGFQGARPVVAYYDATNGDLKLANFNP